MARASAICKNGEHSVAVFQRTVTTRGFNPHYFLSLLINNLDAGLAAAEINARSDQFIRALCLI